MCTQDLFPILSHYVVQSHPTWTNRVAIHKKEKKSGVTAAIYNTQPYSNS